MFFSSVEGGPSEAPRPKGRQMPTPLRVLILEDSPTEAEVMVDHLREAGYTPDWRRVETETDYLAHLDPALDLLLVDYTVPDITGPRALQLLRDRGWDVPAIVVTGTVREEVALDCLRLGANDYILKDRLARLGAALQSALAQRRRGAGARGQYLEVTVIDTGVGIRAEDLPRLFTEFTQLETTQQQWHEGTGLGLALTKRLVELHGGRVWAESEGEGKGSTFTVQLPVDGVAHGAGV